jgi:hypothetical protein
MGVGEVLMEAIGAMGLEGMELFMAFCHGSLLMDF